MKLTKKLIAVGGIFQERASSCLVSAADVRRKGRGTAQAGMIGGEDRYSTPAFDKARTLFLRRAQQQQQQQQQQELLRQRQQQRQQQRAEGGEDQRRRSAVDELTHSLRKLRFGVDALFPIVTRLLAEGGRLEFDGEAGTAAALEMIVDELQHSGQSPSLQSQDAAAAMPSPHPPRSRPLGPFPWPVVDMVRTIVSTGFAMRVAETCVSARTRVFVFAIAIAADRRSWSLAQNARGWTRTPSRL